MKSVVSFFVRLRWIHFPGALIVALLQRTPALRVAAGAAESAFASPAGHLLRSAFASAASLGAMHSLAGATTQLVSNINQPGRATVGTPFTEYITITGLGVSFAQSWSVATTLPPGITVQGGVLQNGRWVVNPSTGTLIITGTPTTAGTYNFAISGYQYINLAGPVTNATAQIVVAAAPNAAPAVTSSPANATVTEGGSATFSITYTGSPAPTFQWLKDGAALSGATSATLTLTNVALTDAAAYAVRLTNSLGTVTSAAATLTVNPLPTAPAFAASPQSQAVGAGSTVVLTVATTGSPAPTIQWQMDGAALSGATGPTLTLADVQPANTGVYTALSTNSVGSTLSSPAIIGVTTANKVLGSAAEIARDIFVAANGNTFDQVLLSGAAATVTAEPGKITRTSFLDLTNDIVQVEFSGAGTLSIVLDNASGPVTPELYNQAVTYMKGHASLVITGADETTNVSVFSVGRITAVNQALFKSDVTYDGLADLAFIAIASTNGKFGGLRTANASYYATRGLTGVYAPGVQFTGPVFIGDINASDAATPMIILGSAADTRITGGDLLQLNGQAVSVSGLTQLKFTAGQTSHGVSLGAQMNQAVLKQNGVNVTADVVVNPSP